MSTMEITTRIGCKNACSYCPQDAFVKAYKARSDLFEMPFDLFKKCLDKVPKHVRIDFSGMAEPWLNRQCTEMLLYAHSKGYSLAVYTTLVGMEKEDIDAIKDIPFQIFEVHLPDGEEYTNIPVNEDFLAKVLRISQSDINNIHYMTIGTLHPEVKKIFVDKVHEHAIIDRAGNLTGFANLPARKKMCGIIRCKSCGTALNHNVLLPNGDVILCCMDYGLKHVLGNLLESSYEDLFQGNAFQGLQKRLNDDSLGILCRHCENAKRSRWNWLPGATFLFKKFTT